MTYLQAAEQAAREAGALLRENFHKDKDIDEAYHHDVKLALDRKSQDLITQILLDAFSMCRLQPRRQWFVLKREQSAGESL